MHSLLHSVLGTRVPIVVPPMAGVGGGALAASASKAGAFGFVAAGYTALKFLPDQIRIAREILSIPESSQSILPIGVGFITWEAASKARNPSTATSQWPALDLVLQSRVKAIWFSFGNAQPLIEYVRQKSPETIIFVQVQHVQDAIVAARDWKANVIVVQGTESGGHGPRLGFGMTTFTLVPTVVDALASHFLNVPVLAAGGVTNGKQLIAARVLGAAGVCVGTRMLATPEALYSQKQKELLVRTTDGSSTVRTRVFDVLRRTDDWPEEYDGRAVQNATTREESSITQENVESMRDKYKTAVEQGDVDRIVTWSGQGVGLIKNILPVADVIREIEAEALDAIQYK